MDSYQHHNPYIRPPPPPPPPPQQPPSLTSDPNHHHYHPHHQQPPPPPPPSNTWYSGQFQYHPQSPSPPPPPPQLQQNHHQWAPQQQSYPPPPPPPPNPNNYHPSQLQPQQQPYPLPPPPYPPPPPQDWGNTNWNHHSGWEHQGESNEEDWAARARAWASSRSQSQFATTIPQTEGHSHYQTQYSQHIEPLYQDGPLSCSGYQTYQAPPIEPSRPPMVHQHEPTSVGSYGPEGHLSYPTTKDGGTLQQQEVPSSYSSVPGVQMDQAQFNYGTNSVNIMDQPLDFVPRSSYESDLNIRASYPDNLGSGVVTDSVFDASSSLHSWTASASVSSGMSYPPIAPTFPSALQHDPTMSVSPLPGQPTPMFGHVGLGATTFPMDVYGSSSGSERSKKAAVPNWLREEIIKKKVTIPSSLPEHSKDGIHSNEDESIDKSLGKFDQADSRSVDSSKSTEDEDDDDEDYEEAQRVAAINQEIKRVLTDVLLKVTDELFDEIATKVLNEDDTATDDIPDTDTNLPNHKTSSPPPVPTPKASVKLLIPEDSRNESSSELPGNVLGLANYASDENEDENPTSNMPKYSHIHAEIEEHSIRTDNNNNNNKGLENGQDSNKKGEVITDNSKKADDLSKIPNSKKSRGADFSGTDVRRSHKHESRVDEKGAGPARREERHQKKDKTHDSNNNNGLKERVKEQSGKKSKESDDKDYKKDRKIMDKDGSDYKREKTKDDKLRHKSSSERDRYKRRRSSSVSKRSKESPSVSDCSVDDVVEESRSRKFHSKRRNSSPSPDRARGRRRRSRSRSPVRRHR